MIALLLISFAAICKAFSDTISHHFDTSIFRHKNRDFWEANRVTSNAKKIFGWKLDAWHISNSLMIIAFIVAVIINASPLKWYWQLLAGGVGFNLTFNVFYNKVFR